MNARAVVALAALAAASCSRASPPSDAASPASPAAPPPAQAPRQSADPAPGAASKQTRVVTIHVPQAVPTSAPMPVHFVAVSGGRVYFSDGSGALWSAPKDGSSDPVPVVKDPKRFVLTFVVRGNDVTFTTTRAIARVGTTGGPVTVLSTEAEDPVSLVADEKEIFFSMFDGSPVRREPWSGGASKPAVSIGIKSGGLALDDAYLYVADYRADVITRVARAGGATRVVARVPKPVAVTADATHLYVSVEGDESLRRVPKAGGRAQVLAKGQTNIDEVVLDGDYVYWHSWRKPHAVMRAKKDGSGEAEVVFDEELEMPSGLAVDEDRVWVANKGKGTVLGILKP